MFKQLLLVLGGVGLSGLSEAFTLSGSLTPTMTTQRSLVTRSRLQTQRLAQPIHMALNAKQMMKNKKGGKKGKKGSKGRPKSGGGGGSSTSSGPIDTNKREYIYQMVGLSKTFLGGKQVLKNIDLSFFPKVKIGIVGVNGGGKSTLMKVMAGLDDDFDGFSKPAAWCKVGHLSQEPELNDGETVGENIEGAVKETKALLSRFNELAAKVGSAELSAEENEKLTAEMERVQNGIEAANGWELDRTLERALDALRCPPSEAKVDTLSGGERRRVALAKLLLQRPDLLLLDEPTNHLDAESVAWLERFLSEFQGTVVAITHDRYFLDNVAGWILELDQGKGIPYEGNYSGWLAKKAARLELEKKGNSRQMATLARELDWLKMSPKAKQAKSKARIGRVEGMQEEAENSNDGRRELSLKVPMSRPLGDIVVEADGVSKAYGDRLLYEGLTFSMPRGGVVGVIGGNGVGKTTLFRMITGQEQPTSGSLTVGETVDLIYVDQGRENLDGDKSVFEEVCEGYDTVTLGKDEVNARQYLGWFGFKSADQQKKVGMLSGGERNRLNLAKTLKIGGNLLLLDEPTNDLDVDTLRSLEEAIEGFPGCAIVISHDRWFLDRVATHILAFEDDGTISFFQGNFEDYEADKLKRLGLVEPKRIKYRPLPVV